MLLSDMMARESFTPKGDILITHYSNNPDLRVIDPEYYGNCAAGTERERAVNTNWINRSYWGLEVGKPGGYVREQHVGRYAYTTGIRGEQLYDILSDPDGLNTGDGITTYEKAIHKAGYIGYWVNDPRIGLVAAIFRKMRVTRDDTLDQVA